MKTAAPLFQVGDKVTTDFNGNVTRHTITRVEPETACQSGWMYWTKPKIGRCDSPVDQGWLKKIELNKQTGGGA